jgi:hypothetical protein
MLAELNEGENEKPIDKVTRQVVRCGAKGEER